MTRLSRPDINQDINANVYLNSLRKIKGNTMQARLLNMAESFANLETDANVPNGFLALDSSGLADVSFLAAASPSGKFLRDDGTYQTVSTGAITGTANTFSMFDGAGGLADTMIVQETDGITIPPLKVFRSNIAGEAEFAYGVAGDEVRLYTDGIAAGNESGIYLSPTDARVFCVEGIIAFTNSFSLIQHNLNLNIWAPTIQATTDNGGFAESYINMNSTQAEFVNATGGLFLDTSFAKLKNNLSVAFEVGSTIMMNVAPTANTWTDNDVNGNILISTASGSINVVEVPGTGGTITLSAPYILMGDGTNGLLMDQVSNAGIITDVTYGVGFVYASDYSATFVNESLITKRYADTKEPAITSSTTAKYWRGDKTFQTLDTSVVPENGSLYHTDARVRSTDLSGLSITGSSISSTDTILQAFGKIQNQINGVLGGAIYHGTYNATTNSPSLVDGTGTQGWYYVVATGGTQNFGSGAIIFNVGDWVIYNGSIWQKVDNTDAVTDVNGSIGSISLTGTSNRITVTGNVWDIAATYVGQTSITTLGTISTGSWTASVIGNSYLATALSGKTYEGLTITATTGAFTLTNGKTLSVSNTLTFTGTDSSSIAFGTGGTVAYTSNNLSVFASTTSAQLAGVISDETGYTSGALLVFSKSPTIETPTIASFANSNHNHQNSAGGGTLDATAVFGATILPEANGGMVYWRTVPGSPVRVGNTSFTITDTGNANLYDFLLHRTTVMKWTDTGVVKMAMVVSTSYSANNVTITIVGDTLSASATMNTFRYSVEKCRPVVLAIAGTIATGTSLTALYHTPCAMKVFGADGYHGTAGTTNATTYDINKNGTTMFTTKVSIASAATSGTGFTADDSTVTAASDVISVDCDSVSTTAPIDAYIQLFVFPLKSTYLN